MQGLKMASVNPLTFEVKILSLEQEVVNP